MSRRLEPQDLYAIQLVEDPQITPDGERIAYVKAEIDRTTYEYHRNIWVTSASGTPGRRFSAGDTTRRPAGRPMASRWPSFGGPPAKSNRRTSTSAAVASGNRSCGCFRPTVARRVR